MVGRIVCSIFLGLWGSSLLAQPLIFTGGHSHNDYHQKEPLVAALQNKMASVEADVFLKDGKLLVGHEESELSADKTFEAMYLKPLYQEYVKKGDGFSPVILMVDIKKGAEPCYNQLKRICKDYMPMLSEYNDGKVTKRAVTIILSGDRPIGLMKKEKRRLAFLDGRITDLKDKIDENLMPLISDNWRNYFSWNGTGEIPYGEYSKLKDMVNQCHEQGKMIRFWGIPGTGEKAVKFWNVLNSAKVNLIGSDDSKAYRNFERSIKND